MTLKEVSEITGIPYITLSQWNRGKGYRKSLARFLKNSDRSVLIKYFQSKTIEPRKKS
ncbi:hypothetical protein CDOMC_1900 [Campylobacter sp. RM16192]|nr:hypothetical protein CDOMC_1900 [Campylobacter sp. RM16192]